MDAHGTSFLKDVLEVMDVPARKSLIHASKVGLGIPHASLDCMNLIAIQRILAQAYTRHCLSPPSPTYAQNLTMLLFTCLPALIVAVACLAIAAPSSSGAIVPACTDIMEAIATHLPTPISAIDKKGGLMVEPDLATCYVQDDPCRTNTDCCAEQICYRFHPEMVVVSAMLLGTENLMIDSFAFPRAFVFFDGVLGRFIHPPREHHWRLGFTYLIRCCDGLPQ